MCRCKKKWYLCEKHKTQPADLKKGEEKKSQPKPQGRSRRKRAKELEEVEADYDKRRVRFSKVDVEIISQGRIRGSMLSSSLKRKFSHLCTEA